MKNEKPLSEKMIESKFMKSLKYNDNRILMVGDVKEAVEELKKELESIKKSLVLFLRGEGEGECEEAYDKIVRLIENDKIFGNFGEDLK